MNNNPLVLISHNYGGGISAYWREQSVLVDIDILYLMDIPKTRFNRLIMLFNLLKVLCLHIRSADRTIISNDWVTHMLVVVLSLLNRNVDLIMMFHGKDFLGRPYSDHLVKILNKTLKSRAKAFFVSRYLEAVYLAAGLKPNSSQIVFPVETKEYYGNQKPRSLTRKLSLLFVGHLNAQKGIYELVQILNRLAGQHHNSEFVLNIVGSGPLYETLRSLNVNFEMHIVGQLSQQEVFKLMRASDLLLFYPRQLEAFGRVVVEANANNCGVLACTEHCSSEIADITTTICVPSEIEFIQTLEKILNNCTKLPVASVNYINPLQEDLANNTRIFL